MGNVKKTLDSGAEIEIQMASFEKSYRLLQDVKASKIAIQDEIDLVVSPLIQPALWDCLAVCLYNSKKINKDTFQDEEARGDFILVAKEALVANLAPFFKSLGSVSSTGRQDLTSEGQK